MTLQEGGQNLVRGLQLMAEDMARYGGLPSKVELDTFELGKDIATSEGAVIHRDAYSEIIQYRLLTRKVRKKPILIVYSVINRFYMLDLNQRRSVVRFLLDQGYQVFAIDNKYQDTFFGLIGAAESIEAAKESARTKGGLEGDEMSWAVNLMQPDRLIYPYLFESYALGERRVRNEITYWLSDQVNIPAGFFEELLAYITENAFIDPEQTSVKGVPVRMDRLDTDLLLVGAQHDTLVPWSAAYKTLEHVSCRAEFVLTNGGHITPATAPRDDKRTGFWSNPGASKDLSSEDWLDGATWHQSSWLYFLKSWLDARSEEQVDPPGNLGSEKWPELYPASGTYVKE